jgi:hypothetical protein
LPDYNALKALVNSDPTFTGKSDQQVADALNALTETEVVPALPLPQVAIWAARTGVRSRIEAAPTVAAQVQVQVAADAAGTLWVNFGGPLGGSTTASAVSSWSVEIPIGASAVRTVSGSNTGQAVTLDADVSGVTGV